jgi:hypothetical protein
MTATRLALALALVSCGGDEPARSGVDPTIAVVDLLPPDIQIFCEWAIDLEGGFGSSQVCDDGSTITTQSVAICVDTLADLTCTDPIGDFEDCLLAIDGNLCLLTTTSACTGFVACFPQ